MIRCMYERTRAPHAQPLSAAELSEDSSERSEDEIFNPYKARKSPKNLLR